MENFSLRFTGSPVFSFCICWTIVSDSSELNTVKQGREEWRSKCSKISVGRNRSRHNFFFSTNTKYVNRWNKKKHNFFCKMCLIFSPFLHHSVADYWKPFPQRAWLLFERFALICLFSLEGTPLHSQTVGRGSWKSNGFIGFQLAMMPPLKTIARMMKGKNKIIRDEYSSQSLKGSRQKKRIFYSQADRKGGGGHPPWPWP